MRGPAVRAEQSKQAAYDDTTRLTTRARWLDAVGASGLADNARAGAADAAQMAVRMETCPRVAR